MIWRGRRTDTGEAVQVTIHDGVIESVQPTKDEESLPWISPGWIDIQVNGFAGYDLIGDVISEDDVVGLTKALFQRGVTTYFPTVTTGSFEKIHKGMSTIAQACRTHEEVKLAAVGIHLEGPYFAAEDGPRGAHDRMQIRNPDYEEFKKWQEASGGMIRLVTLAPEKDGAIPFIRRLVQEGVVISIGHTMATTEQLDEAVKAGATLSTHLGNGAHPMLPRHPNYIWDQLADDRLWATFIPDGHHLPPNVLRAMMRVKREKSIFVSDSVKFGGMPPGKYSASGLAVELHPNGRLNTVENPAILAGSAQALDDGIGTAVHRAGITLQECIEASTVRPANAMGLERLGVLESGAIGNLTLFRYSETEGKIQVVETVLHGRTVYEA